MCVQESDLSNCRIEWNYFSPNRNALVRSGFKGPRGPGPQASHQQRASHQTRHILFVVHASCLQNYGLVLMHCWRHAHGRVAETQLNPLLRYKAESFLPVFDQFIASLDQHLRAYKLLSGQFALVACSEKKHFLNGGRPASLIFEIWYFSHATCTWTWLCFFLPKNRVNRAITRRDITKNDFQYGSHPPYWICYDVVILHPGTVLSS